MRDWKDKWCLITGASSGIGAEFARQLAASGARLVLVARREERLRELADELMEKHRTESRIVSQDLLEESAAAVIREQTTDLEIDVLINNAGFGHYGLFSEMEDGRIRDLLNLNVTRLVEVTHQFLPQMLERRRGVIVHVASTASFQAMPYQALYAASKAFVLHFSEGLWGEVRKNGVHVQALCPGFTRTEFFAEADLPESVPFGTMDVDKVVAASLRAAAAGKRQFLIPGLANYLLALSTRLVPRRMSVQQSARMLKPGKHGR